MDLQPRPSPSVQGTRFPRFALALVALMCCARPVKAQTISKTPQKDAPARVGFAVQFTGVSDMDKETLRAMMIQRAESIRARVKRMAANDAQDFWVQAKVARRADEEGNLGFDLRLVGRYRGQSLRWPELGRRCTFCTNGEFVDMFAEAFSALMDRPMPELPEETPAGSVPLSGASEIEPATLASSSSARASATKPLTLPPANRLPQGVVTDRRHPTPSRVRRAPSLRWWGWMGLGLSAAGSSSIVASLATMPRNVPLPTNPAKMYPARPDTATKIGLAVGGTCLLAGVSLWVVDLVTRTREGSSPKLRRSVGSLLAPAAIHF